MGHKGKLSLTIKNTLAALHRLSPLCGIPPEEAFCCLLFFGLPLVMWQGFFFVTEAKGAFLILLTLVFIPLSIKGRGEVARHLFRGEGLAGMGGLLPLLLCFFFQILASLLGPAPGLALLAPDNRYQGIVTLLCYGWMALFLGGRGGLKKTSACPGAAAFVLVSLLGILNRLGLDPLGTLRPLTAFDRGRYLSTLGNINFLSAYLVLTVPMLFLAALVKGPGPGRWVLFSISGLGLWALVAAGCDSALLGLGAAVLALPCLLGDSPKALKQLPIALGGGLLSMKLAQLFFAGAGCTHLSPLFSTLLEWPCLLAFLGLLALLQGLFHLRKEAALAPALLRYRRALLFGLALGLIFILLLNTALSHLPLRGSLACLRLSESWGTDRGRIWSACIRLFGKLPLWQKLMGGGSGVLAQNLTQGTVFPDAAVDAAHNEYLHLLLTGGILGLGSYLLFLIPLLSRGFRRGQSPRTRALTLGILAYAAQGLVNIAQPATTPLFFALLSLLFYETGQGNPRKNPETGKY